MPPPERPSIYHITHVDNLPSMVADGGLHSDAAMVARGGPASAIGMSNIKARRLTLPVDCHPGDRVGDYVPFYFCPRSLMLYVIYRGNRAGLTFQGGQGPIVHLESDLHIAVAWAAANARRWAVTSSNAAARYTLFHADLASLSDLDWDAIAATDFRPQAIKEGKQAEFLVHGFFPWTLVTRVGVHSQGVKTRVEETLADAPHKPRVDVLPAWYY